MKKAMLRKLRQVAEEIDLKNQKKKVIKNTIDKKKKNNPKD